MRAATTSPGLDHPTTVRTRRSRAYPRPARLWLASLLLLIAFLGFAAFGALGIAMAATGNRLLGVLSLVAFGIFLVSRGLAFALSRHLHCPLCHGTVLSEKRCRKHARAARLPPLSFRATAALSALLTLAFRCMYCGTRFRLTK